MKSRRMKWSLVARLAASTVILLALALTLTLSSSDSVTASEPDLVVNGSFEQPVVNINNPWGRWDLFLPQAVPGWSLSAGTYIELQNNDPGAPHDGSQLLELDSDAATSI